MVVPHLGMGLPRSSIYNTAVLVAFALTAYGMARLARELTGDALVGVLAGALVRGGAVPLRAPPRAAASRLDGLGAALPRVSPARRRRSRPRARCAPRRRLPGARVARLLVPSRVRGGDHHAARASRARGVTRPRDGVAPAAPSGLVLASRVGRARRPVAARRCSCARQREPILGAHDPLAFSADAAVVLRPGLVGARRPGRGSKRRTSDSRVAALAILGAFRDRSRSPRFSWSRSSARLLALGPVLHVARRSRSVGACPTRISSRAFRASASRGCRCASGTSCTRVSSSRRRSGSRRSAGSVGRRRSRRVRSSRSRRSRSGSTGRGPVIDLGLSGAGADASLGRRSSSRGRSSTSREAAGRPMWHATLHRKPIVGGYIGRRPEAARGLARPPARARGRSCRPRRRSRSRVSIPRSTSTPIPGQAMASPATVSPPTGTAA